MVSGSKSSDAQNLRFLGGGNDNNNNNNNNNNNQNYGDRYKFVTYESFNPLLFASTLAYCAIVTLLVVLKMKLHRKSNKKRKRLGLPPASRENRKRSKNGDDEEDNIITDEEIHRYVLPSKQEQSVKEAAKVVRCDRETERIMGLCKPFWMEAFVSGICDVFNTALIGKVLGVDSLAIFYIVTVPTSFTETIIGAVLETVSSLGGQSIGVGSYKLTGQYCQISIILYTILYIPHAILWITCLKPTLRWFAPDLGEEVIEEGYKYFLVSLVGTYIESYSTVLHSLLEVSDHYGYGTKSEMVHNLAGVLGFFLYVKANPAGQKSIVMVEVIWTCLTFAFLIIDLMVAKRMKWFDDFWKGILRSVAMKNWEAVWLVLKTAAPLSMGNIIMTVEWELLAIFAASMGGIQVAAWGIVGTIWGILEYATACVASAGEIRVAKLLGNGNPRLAKLSAYKCLFLGNAFASIMSILFLVGLPYIPSWFTDDGELHGLVANVLPYCAIGNLTLTIGSLAWTLVGAQGRYSVATFHGCIGSLLITIPCAALSTYRLGWELPSLAASVVIGYMTSGAFNSITLFLSDWEYISYRVMIKNGATEPVEEDEDYEDQDEEPRWNVFNFMKTSSLDGNDSHRNTNRTLLVDTLTRNTSSLSVEDDGSNSASSKRSLERNYENGPVTNTSSWWASLGVDQSEVREVLIGPGKLGYTIQSTKRGPMIVRCPKESNQSFIGPMRGTSHRGRRAIIISGDLFLGDIIVQIDEIPTDKMCGRELGKILSKRSNRESRKLIVSHREGTGLATVYQPGPYGSAAITGVLKNAKEIQNKEFEDEGVVGAGYFNMGWFS